MSKQHFYDNVGYSISTIRPIDIESIRIWRNAQVDVLRQKKSISTEDQMTYFAHVIWPSMTESFPKQILFSYFFEEQLIGYGGLTHMDWEAKRAEVSFLVTPERIANPKLYQSDFSHFLKLLAQVAFKELKFHRLFTETYAFRKDHLEVIESVGFKLEGILRDHVFEKNQWFDSLMHGLLSKEINLE